MSHWVRHVTDEIDVGILEESALARAQSTVQRAINQAGISRADLARRMGCHRSFVSRMLSGDHNLTIKTMARALAVCGFEARFQHAPIVWNWRRAAAPVECAREVPANAGTASSAIEMMAGLAVPVSFAFVAS